MANQWALIGVGLLWLLACRLPDGDNSAKASLRNEEFARKRFCAEIARTRLAEDNQEKYPNTGLLNRVDSEWCYSKSLNTCIYSSTTVIAGKREAGASPSFLQSRETIDLLTNHSLASLSLKEEPDQAESAKYEKRKRELFKECQ
jgi:hypothetical protein